MAISINEFVALVAIVTNRHGKGVMMSEQTAENRMDLSLDDKHLGYIDIATGSLVWDAEDPRINKVPPLDGGS